MTTPLSTVSTLALHAAPAMLMIALTLVSAVQLRVPGLAQFMPMFAVIGTYYWSLYRPTLIPYLFLFVLGIVQDGLQGTPIGVTSLVLIMLRALMLPQRRFFSNEAFVAVWLGFLVFALLASLGFWVIHSLEKGMVILSDEPVIQWGMTVSLYPLFHALFNGIYFALPGTAKKHK